jgi:hypothetical protein
LKFENHQYYNCEVTLDDGSKFLINANWLHNNELDQWQGWQCNAGVLRLDIDENFNVHSGECQNQYLGNLFTEWAVLTAPGICNHLRCSGCTDDLIISKQKITIIGSKDN